MKFITKAKLTNKEIYNFISSILSTEYAVFYNKKNKFIDFSPYLQISSRDEQGIVVSSNYNCGLVSYNIFTLTDFEFKSLYPMCNGNYTNAWRNFLSNRFSSYNHELKKYIKKQEKTKND